MGSYVAPFEGTYLPPAHELADMNLVEAVAYAVGAANHYATNFYVLEIGGVLSKSRVLKVERHYNDWIVVKLEGMWDTGFQSSDNELANRQRQSDAYEPTKEKI